LISQVIIFVIIASILTDAVQYSVSCMTNNYNKNISGYNHRTQTNRKYHFLTCSLFNWIKPKTVNYLWNNPWVIVCQWSTRSGVLRSVFVLEEKASSDALCSFCEYIRSTWIDSTYSMIHPIVVSFQPEYQD